MFDDDDDDDYEVSNGDDLLSLLIFFNISITSLLPSRSHVLPALIRRGFWPLRNVFFATC